MTDGDSTDVQRVTDRRTVAGVLPRALVVVYLKGVAMGTADAVPGVSGGTIALITGIYERLIGAITAVDADRVLSVLAAPLPGRRDEALRAFSDVDGAFLLALGAGIATAVVTVTRLLDVAIDEVPVLTFGFFFGLIAASAYVLYGQVRLDTRGRKAAAVAGFLLAFVASGSASAALGTGGPVTFFAGAVAVSAMILPGISGSLLLIILGQYEFMVETLREFVDRSLSVLTGGDVAGVVAPGTVVVAFVAGALVGLFTVAHAVRWALSNYRRATLAFLVSLIVGALRAPVESANEKLLEAGGAWSAETVGVFLVAAVVGAALVVGLDRATGIAVVE